MRSGTFTTVSLLALPLVTGAAAAQPAPCADSTFGAGARCGVFSVPENHDVGGGRRIGIRYVVLPADEPGAREAVLLFAGGPGDGSTGLAGLANGALRPVRRTRDVLLVDQRGTGESNPLLCDLPIVEQPALAFGHVFDPATFRRCRAGYPDRADVAQYTTANAVRDLELLRAALGYQRVLVYGLSYGTRMAQAYARAHPERVSAVVLDGVVPFDFRAPADYARSAQQALDRVIADCRAAPGCAAEHPRLAERFARLLARFEGGAIAATVRRPDGTTAPVRFSRGDFGYAVRGILYRAAGARALPAMIALADSTGNLDPFAQRYWEREANFAGFANGLHFAIFCHEDVPFIGDQEIDRLAAGTYLGRYLLDEYRTVCRDWGAGPIGAAGRRPLRGPVPTLLLSGWFDPVTPPETGERVARALENAVHLVIRNEAHGSSFRCALPAVLHVLTHATLEGIPPVCQGITNLWPAPRSP